VIKVSRSNQLLWHPFVMDATEWSVRWITDTLPGKLASSCRSTFWTARIDNTFSTIIAFPSVEAFANWLSAVIKAKKAFPMTLNASGIAQGLIAQVSSETSVAYASVRDLYGGVVWVHTTAPNRNIASGQWHTFITVGTGPSWMTLAFTRSNTFAVNTIIADRNVTETTLPLGWISAKTS